MHGNELLAVRLGEGSPHLVRLGGGHPRHVHDELYNLLLPDDDAVPPRKGALLQRVVVLPGGAVAVSLHELGHGAPLGANGRAGRGPPDRPDPAGCAT